MKSRRSIKAKVASLKNSNKMHKSLRTHLYSFPFMDWNDYANLEVCWGWWSGLRANPPLPSNDILYGCRFVSWLQPSQSGTQFMAWGSKCNTVQSLGIVHLYRESGKKVLLPFFGSVQLLPSCRFEAWTKGWKIFLFDTKDPFCKTSHTLH